MFIEAAITREELQTFLLSALPLTIRLDDTGGSHFLALDEMTELAMVPDTGVRLTCRAHLHWPLLGIDAPLTLSALRVLLVPEVTTLPTGEALRFRIALEHVDISGVPGVFDETIDHAVNARLAAHHLSWDFSTTFARLVPLPKVLEPLASLSMRAAWGKVRITEEALVFAVSLHNTIVPERDAAAGPRLPPRARTDERRALMAGSPVGASSLAVAAVFGLVAGAAFFALRSATSRW